MQKTNIQIVLVLYKTNLQDSLSYTSFLQHVAHLSIPYSLLIYNNSPEVTVPASASYEVITAQQNHFLQGAYTEALRVAQKNGAEWLLLLDQDTQLTDAYFKELSDLLSSGKAKAYDTLVPQLKKGEVHLSPCYYPKHKGPFWNSSLCPYQGEDLQPNQIYVAFNSATVLSIAAIQAIGGFDALYPLDMLDYDYFYKLCKQSSKMYVMSCTLEQELSLLSIDTSMSLTRYQAYMCACKRFARSLGRTCACLYRVRLCRTLLAQLLIAPKRKFAKFTFYSLFSIR